MCSGRVWTVAAVGAVVDGAESDGGVQLMAQGDRKERGNSRTHPGLSILWMRVSE